MTRLEFWPDYAGALLWNEGGERVPLEAVPLPPNLIDRANRWIAKYDDSKLPWGSTRDGEWLAEGKRLFDEFRRELFDHDIELQPDEDFWRPRDQGPEVPAGDAAEH